MAVDTRDKRASAIGTALPVPSVLPNPDGSINQGDRQQLAFAYRGITAGQVVEGPFCVVAQDTFTPGSVASDTFTPGAAAADTFTPGSVASDAGC